MTKAERETLKAEYITGDYRTLKEFAEAKGLSYHMLWLTNGERPCKR